MHTEPRRCRGGFEVAAVECDAFTHPDQAASAAIALARIALARATLVDHLDVDGPWLIREAHPGACASSVLEGIGQGFLDDPVGGQLHAGIERPAGPLHRQLDREAGGADFLDEAADALQPGHRLACGIVLGRRVGCVGRVAQHAEHPAHVGQCLAARPVDGFECGTGPFRASIKRGQAGTGLDDDHADVVGDDVVQLAGDPFPFVLDGPRDRSSRSASWRRAFSSIAAE